MLLLFGTSENGGIKTYFFLTKVTSRLEIYTQEPSTVYTWSAFIYTTKSISEYVHKQDKLYVIGMV